jgi:4-hydroxy-2-oxoheptanedioate aldolase
MNDIMEKSNVFKSLTEKKLIGIKISFEDEGADFIDVLSVKFLCLKYGINLVLKIGGPEAIRDIKDANKLQIKNIVAPMVESKFALEKYIKSCNRFLTNSEQVKLGVNIETINAVNQFDEFISSKYFEQLSSVTVGRGDLVQSMDLDRYNGSVDSEEVYNLCVKVFQETRKSNKQCLLGGSMTKKSSTFVTELIKLNLLDKFETRNIIFYQDALKYFSFDDLMDLAFDLEFSQMERRREYYERLYNQDLDRINRLKK